MKSKSDEVGEEEANNKGYCYHNNLFFPIKEFFPCQILRPNNNFNNCSVLRLELLVSMRLPTTPWKSRTGREAVCRH